MATPRYTFKLIIWVPVKRLFCDDARLSREHMVLVARTARIYHDSFVGLVGFQQFGEMSRPRAKINDGIEFPFDILFDSQVISPCFYDTSYVDTSPTSAPSSCLQLRLGHSLQFCFAHLRRCWLHDPFVLASRSCQTRGTPMRWAPRTTPPKQMHGPDGETGRGGETWYRGKCDADA